MNLTSIQSWSMTPGGIAVWVTLLFGLFFGSLLINVDRKIRLGREAALIAPVSYTHLTLPTKA